MNLKKVDYKPYFYILNYSSLNIIISYCKSINLGRKYEYNALSVLFILLSLNKKLIILLGGYF